jgi:crossover junction endodeoxyribonuclease RusA
VTVFQTPRTGVDPHSHQPGGTTEPRRWIIDIPPGTVLLNLNGRLHWAKEARIKRNIKATVQQLAIIQRIPRLERAHVSGLLHVPDRRKRDPHNWALTYKEAVDGIVAAHVLRDDSSEYLTDGGIDIGDFGKPLSFSLIIVEVIS